MNKAMAMVLTIATVGLGLAGPAAAESAVMVNERSAILGVAIRAGGRFDNVRMCVATPEGVKGGPAGDIALFAEVATSDNVSWRFNLPLVRPILFAVGFEMLQLEPEIGLLFRIRTQGKVDVIVGPTLGVSLHYGPDYKSEASGTGRRPSFFAMGPQAGAYVGLDFKRPGETFNFQLGLSPYAAFLIGIDDPEDHRGVVVGGMLDGLLRFSL